MKLLLDQGLPRSAALLLRNAGIETLHVGEIGLASADDISIIERARQEHEVVVTLDADFHALPALSGALELPARRCSVRSPAVRGKKTDPEHLSVTPRFIVMDGRTR